ncbi:MAG: DUF2291 domain-containing protein [Acetobacteraceae bacterium]
MQSGQPAAQRIEAPVAQPAIKARTTPPPFGGRPSAALASRVRYPRTLASLAGLVLLAVLWANGMVATVHPLGGAAAEDSAPSSGLAFSPAAYVARIWKPRVVQAARHESVTLPELLAALAKDRKAALAHYGHEVAGTWNILVRFSGTVSGVDTSSPIGTLTIDAASSRGTIPVKIAIGPVILGTTLRDSLNFISFGEFLNQIQYGAVADELNNRVVKDVVGPLHGEALKGRKLTVFGAYTYDDADPDDITVTPVLLEAIGNPAR